MNARTISRVSGLLALAAALVAVTAYLASSTRPDPDARPTGGEVQSRVMSPFCPGLTLEDCPTDEAVVLRGRIDEKVREGWTNRRIDEWLVAIYGEGVLGSPSSPAVWAVPTAWVLGGSAAVCLLLSSWAKKKKALETPAEVTDRDRARLEAELQSFANGTTE